MSIGALIAGRIHREGPIPFDVFMELALYEPEGGFFGSGRGAGRAGRDFVTSPEVGPLFGACVARDLDRRWADAGRPDPFLVVEAGAGAGRLAREVQRATPQCGGALRYVLVERSPQLRAAQRQLLTLEPADEALGPFMRDPGGVDADDETLAPVPRSGPVFSSLADLPEMPVPTVVLANELLDNLPFGIAHWDGRRWLEVRVAVRNDAFVELLVPAAPDDATDLDRIAPARRPDGMRLPIARGLDAWIDSCGRALRRGVLVLVDYIVEIDDFTALDHRWLRTYRAHERGAAVLSDPGSQDLTGDVLRPQLERAAHASGFVVTDDRSQAEWLSDLGIGELVDEGRRQWDAGAARGDLAALVGRSRVTEAAALTDPAGLGAHRVVTLTKV